MRRPKVIAYISILLIIISVLWISRKIIFKNVLDRLVVKTEKKFNLTIRYTQADLNGFSSFYFTGIKVTDKQNNEIVNSDSVVFNLKTGSLILGKIKFRSFCIYDAKIDINSKLLELLNKRKPIAENELNNKNQSNYAELTNKLFTSFYDYLPHKIIIRNTNFVITKNSSETSILFENLIFSNNKFVGDIVLSDSIINSECLIVGELNPSTYNFSCKITHQGEKMIKLPYLEPNWKASVGFDTLQLSCTFQKKSDIQSALSGYISVDKLQIFNNRISPDTVSTNSGLFQYKLNIGKRFLEVDSSSTLKMNNFWFSPYFKIQKDTSVKINFAFIRSVFEAKDLFSSLPQGLFTNFNGLETSGKLAYHMNVEIDLGDPDKVKFNSKLENIDFSIKKFGETNLQLMNNAFRHEVFENNRLVASFVVGPENNDFVSLNDISPYLKYSILTSEDGDFFYHKGFNEDAFRESIAKNIKENRFARGGSTITMQLVKNVFLSRKKTISRKLEEAIIVWMIENMRLTSKERMYEVYLNVIEWGPGVYGIKPAAEFYFKKQPIDLTLAESIYLTSLIPRPKGFRYTFDKSGRIRDYLVPYYQLLSGIMVRRNQITPEDTMNLKPISKLTGEAKNLLASADSSNIDDSLFYLQPLNITPTDLIPQ